MYARCIFLLFSSNNVAKTKIVYSTL